MDFPEINQELCTGCGACIDICPMEAIVMQDGKACIVEDNCGNCRVCESACPLEAIG